MALVVFNAHIITNLIIQLIKIYIFKVVGHDRRLVLGPDFAAADYDRQHRPHRNKVTWLRFRNLSRALWARIWNNGELAEGLFRRRWCRRRRNQRSLFLVLGRGGGSNVSDTRRRCGASDPNPEVQLPTLESSRADPGLHGCGSWRIPRDLCLPGSLPGNIWSWTGRGGLGEGLSFYAQGKRTRSSLTFIFQQRGRAR